MAVKLAVEETPLRGEPIFWYPDGVRSQTPTLADCIGFDPKTGQVVLVGWYKNQRVFHDGTQHVSDPRLAGSPVGAKLHGSWERSDFGSEVRMMASRIAALEQKLAILQPK